MAEHQPLLTKEVLAYYTALAGRIDIGFISRFPPFCSANVISSLVPYRFLQLSRHGLNQ